MSLTSVELWQKISAAGLAAPMICRSWAAEALQALPPTDATDAEKILAQLVKIGRLTNYQAELIAGKREGEFKRGAWTLLQPAPVPLWEDWFEVNKTTAGPVTWMRWIDSETLGTLRTSAPSLPRGLRLAQIQSQHLQTVHVPELIDKQLQLQVEPLSGLPLSVAVQTAEPLSGSYWVDQSAAIIEQIAAALQPLHAAGLAHGRVLPDRIYWDATTQQATLVRDPLCAVTATNDGSAGGVIRNNLAGLATTQFIAPEYLMPGQQPTISTDIYSLGCTWWWLVTGQPLVVGSTPEKQLARQAEASLAMPKECPLAAPYVRVLQHCLAKNLPARFASADALCQALQAARVVVAKGQVPRAKPAPTTSQIAQPEAAVTAAPVAQNLPSPTEQLPPAKPTVAAKSQIPESPAELKVTQKTAQKVAQSSATVSKAVESELVQAEVAQPQTPSKPAASSKPVDDAKVSASVVAAVGGNAATAKTATAKATEALPTQPSEVKSPPTSERTTAPKQPVITPAANPTAQTATKTAPRQAVASTVATSTVPNAKPALETAQSATTQASSPKAPDKVLSNGNVSTPNSGAQPESTQAQPAANPASAQTVATQPVATQTVTTQPSATQPVATQPVATQTVATQPSATQPSATQPSANQVTAATTSKPVATKATAARKKGSAAASVAGKRKSAKRQKSNKWMLPVVGGFGFVSLVLMILLLSGGLNRTPKPAETPVNPGLANVSGADVTPDIKPRDPRLEMYRIVSSGKETLWAPPGLPTPLKLDLLPPGGQMFLSLHPKALLAAAPVKGLLSALDSDIAPWLADITQRSGQPLELIEQCTVAFYAENEQPITGLRITLAQPQPLSALKAVWGNPSEEKVGTQSLLTNAAGISYYVANQPLSDAQSVSEFSVGPTSVMRDVPESEGAAGPLITQMERLWQLSDTNADLSLLFAPAYLSSEGKKLLAAAPKRLKSQVESALGTDVRAVLIQTRLEPQWYIEMQAIGTDDRATSRINEEMRQRISNASPAVEEWFVSESPHPYWRPLALRLPQMFRTFSEQTRFGVESGVAMANASLPKEAATNIMLASWIALQDGATLASDAIESVATNTPAAKPLSLDDYLGRTIKLRFDQEPIEVALRLIGEEANANLPSGTPTLRYELDGSAFEKAGITRNQQVRDFMHVDKPVREALTALAKRGNPVTTVTDTRDKDQRLIWVVMDDPMNPGKKMVSLTTRDAATTASIPLPVEFAPAQ